MKKLGLLSVATAVAIAGLGTSAFAKPMEEAIKGVDVSGYVRYRFTDDSSVTNSGTGADSKSNAHTHKYKTNISIKSKINDMAALKMKMSAESKIVDTDGATGDADPTGHAAINEVNFVFNAGGNTIIAGKQALATPFADGGDQQGTGVVGLFPIMDGLTLAAGWYDNSDAIAMQDPKESNLSIGTNNITAVAAIGKAGSVNYAVWYAMVDENQVNTAAYNYGGTNVTDVTAGATAMNINVAGKFGPVGVELNYATVDYSVKADGSSVAALSYTPVQTRVVANAGLGFGTVTGGMVMTDASGGDVTLGDTDAQSNFALEQASASAFSDASLMYVGVATKMGVGFGYLTGSGYDSPLATGSRAATDKKTDATEMKISYGKSLSPNFKVSTYYSMLATKAGSKKNDNNEARIEMKYSF